MAIIVQNPATHEEFMFPITPSQIKMSEGVRFFEYDIMNVGVVKMPSGAEITEVSWSGILPGSARGNHQFIVSDVTPTDAITVWKSWKKDKTKLRLTIGGSDFDDFVYLSNYTFGMEGGFGDFSYDISFIRAGSITVNTGVAPGEGSGGGGGDSGGETETTYTTQKNDTLYKIAKKFYGKGKLWTKIYQANTNVLKKKKHKLPGGLVLVIPK